jgi:hypothetical protein
MPFYLRKSLKAGPFRFNLSKSGIGVSAGIPGFRVGTGPKGNYIHMGRNGVYYRSTIQSPQPPRPSEYLKTPIVNSPISHPQFSEIESADIFNFHDASSEKLLSEINEKHQIPEYWLIISVICILSLFLLPPLFRVTFKNEIILLILPVIFLLSIGLYLINSYQKTVILFYTMDTEQESAYQTIHDAFNKILSCGRIRHIEATKSVNDPHERKRQAGASNLLKCRTIYLTNSSPKWIKTNIAVPHIPVGKQSLYFFPDKLLIQDGNRFGAIQYCDLKLMVTNSRFVETEGLTKDAKVVDQTWLHPNKNGGPDRRFSNNHELPVILCTEIHFSNSQGLNELIQLSIPDLTVGNGFAEAIHKLSQTIISNNAQLISPEPVKKALEEEIIEFFTLMGNKVIESRKTNDFTTDFLIQGKNQEKWIARSINKTEVTENLVRDFQNILSQSKPSEAALISNGSFSPSALELIEDSKVHLMDKDQFTGYLNQARMKNRI